MKIISIGMVIIISAANFGCSAFKSSTQTVSINCNPPDATLMVNGQRFKSPAQIKVKRNRDVAIQCYKEGYFSYQRTTVCFLLPGIGLFCSGAWDLDETDLNIELTSNQNTKQ